MTDRIALLDGIAASPWEDMPRLMYADWLEEFGTSDLDRATIEFIRMSCDNKAGGRRWSQMPRAVYPWLDKNWHRLLPSVVNFHEANWGNEDRKFVNDPGKIILSRKGRHFHAAIKIAPEVRQYAVWFAFSRGFCDLFRIYAGKSFKALEPVVLADQPLVKFYGVAVNTGGGALVPSSPNHSRE